ncbi:MAG: preprotein translocase subunit SecG [Chitinivibrionales bacterium]|nr:preprotein translocase subunit SecG [Chitinivibrionales bacterium]
MVLGIIVVLYVIVCIFLVLLVLIQSDKGGGISGAIGGGLSGASALLGTQDTANILTRATTIFASAFMVLCIIIFLMVSHSGTKQQKSVLRERAEKQQNFNPSSILHGQGLPIAPAGKPGAGALPMAPNQTLPKQAPQGQSPAGQVSPGAAGAPLPMAPATNNK